MAILPVGIGPQEGGYQIERSLRFNSADSAYLSRTPASAGNRKTWTISVWIKRTNPGTENWVYDGGSTSNSSGFQFTDTNLLRVLSTSSSGAVDDLDIRTTQVFRDPSAWYHIVLAVDTTQATSTNRVKLYVNGSQVTAFGTANYPTQNYDFGVNNNHSQKIGKWNISTGRDFSGYMADFYLVDGSALAPTSFGEYNSDTGVWQPKAYTGSYGTNGFYLNFSDNSGTTSTTLGKDYSGNSNNWTPNNFSVTAGAGNDSLVDTPTPYGTDTGAGGEVRGNYATWNPTSSNYGQAAASLSNGNLEFNGQSSYTNADSSVAVSSGKWYHEVTVTGSIAQASEIIIGWNRPGSYGSTLGLRANAATSNLTITSGSAFSYTVNDVIGIALDYDAWQVTYYKNGTQQFVATITASKPTAASAWVQTGSNTGVVLVANFGQRPFAYTAPSGFKALCTQNLPEPTVKDGGNYMNAVLYTGDGTNGRSITGVGFQTDFNWTKSRSSGAYYHQLSDAVRGFDKYLYSNATNAEGTDATNHIQSVNSDGYVINSGASFNASGVTYVAWNWKAGGTGVTNTAGTITSTVSANTTAGFSIVTYTGTGSNATVGHGLSSAPSFVICKSRNNTYSWVSYHTSLGASAFIELNSTGAATTGRNDVWNATAPSSTVVSLGTVAGNNASGTTYVAYCFAPVSGFSSAFSYTGNGSSDGSFVYLGFKPKMILIKRTDTTADWVLYDTERNTYNVAMLTLYPNLSNAEGTVNPSMDILSNGVKFRNSTSTFNASGGTYIGFAWAESPFKYSLAR